MAAALQIIGQPLEGVGGCPTGYNSLGQLTGQLKELVEGAAAQQIIVQAADQSAKARGQLYRYTQLLNWSCKGIAAIQLVTIRSKDDWLAAGNC